MIDWMILAQAVTAPAASGAAPAAAAGTSGAAGGGTTGALLSFAPIILMFVVFYFLVLRPQQKRMKEHQAMLTALKRGDVVVTNGGLIGKVSRVDDKEIQIELSENVRVRVVRHAIAELRSKGDPVAANDSKAG